MAERKKQNVLEFLVKLIPSKVVPIGDSASIIIEAMRLKEIKLVAIQLIEFAKKVHSKGVTWENYESQESLIIMGTTIIGEFPMLLSDITNVELESLEAMPLELVVEIVSAAIEVNISSKETFLKNFKSLVGNLRTLTSNLPKVELAPQKTSKTKSKN